MAQGWPLLLLLIVCGAAVESSPALGTLKAAVQRLKSDTDRLVDAKVLAAKRRAISAIDTVISGLSGGTGTNASATPGSVKIETIEVTEQGLKMESITTRIGAGAQEKASNCSLPWLLVREDMCMWSPPLKGSWHDADAFCAQHGASLATVRSREEARLVEMFHKIDELCPWVGLFRSANSKVSSFAWIDGNPAKYRFWAQNQPDGKDHNKRRFPGAACGILCQHGFLDMPCASYLAPFVCQKKMV